jgi:hypothetical protein
MLTAQDSPQYHQTDLYFLLQVKKEIIGHPHYPVDSGVKNDSLCRPTAAGKNVKDFATLRQFFTLCAKAHNE